MQELSLDALAREQLEHAVPTQNSTGAPGGAEAGDRFGASAAIGDTDKDGRAEAVVGAPGENADGLLWIARGSASGPVVSGSAATSGTAAGLTRRYAEAPTVERGGFRIKVPESWGEFDVRPESRDDSIRRMVSERLRVQPELAPHRDTYTAFPRKAAADAWK